MKAFMLELKNIAEQLGVTEFAWKGKGEEQALYTASGKVYTFRYQNVCGIDGVKVFLNGEMVISFLTTDARWLEVYSKLIILITDHPAKPQLTLEQKSKRDNWVMENLFYKPVAKKESA